MRSRYASPRGRPALDARAAFVRDVKTAGQMVVGIAHIKQFLDRLACQFLIICVTGD
jgi:hypothetical protein